jgi:hypothetical protein
VHEATRKNNNAASILVGVSARIAAIVDRHASERNPL